MFDFARDVPEQVALVAAQAESAQVFAVPELVARAESRVVGPDLSEALVARAEAEVSALRGLLAAQFAPAQAAASDARVGLVRTSAEPKAAQSAV